MINKDTGSLITIDEAIEFTHSFQRKYPDTVKSFFVGIDKLRQILEQENCMGVRIYNGIDPDTETPNLVLIGVNSEDEDMTDGIIVERLKKCPPDCPDTTPLIIT